MSRSVRQDYERYRRDSVGIALVEAIHTRKDQRDQRVIQAELNLYSVLDAPEQYTPPEPPC